MGLPRVIQTNDNGCFVACVASLFNISYESAFKKIHPFRGIESENHGFICHNSVVETAYSELCRLGIKARISDDIDLNKLIINCNKPAIIIVRWHDDIEMCHTVLFNPLKKMVIDPSPLKPISNKKLNRQVEGIIYIDELPN